MLVYVTNTKSKRQRWLGHLQRREDNTKQLKELGQKDQMGQDHKNTEDSMDKSSSGIEDSRFFIVNQYCKSRAYNIYILCILRLQTQLL